MHTPFQARIGAALLWLVWFLPACDGGGGDADGGPDGGADTDPDCAEGDTFDEADCPQTYPDYSCVVYVDGSLGASGDGFSWDGAKRTVQEGLDLARCGVLKTSVCDQWQVWVRAGRYHVHQGCREHTLRLRKNVGLYGGFAGGESALEQRDFAANGTILDGANAQDAEQRVFHVVTADDSTRLDGFTVTGGLADGSGDGSSTMGGGVLASGKTDIALENCVIRENEGASGGGLVLGDGQLFVRNCLFENNRAFRPSEDFSYMAHGGGIYAFQAGIVIDDSVFRSNTVEEIDGYGGGAALACHTSSQVTITNTVIEDNEVSGSYGGGIWVALTDSFSISDSTFQGNVAPMVGGALVLAEVEAVSVTGCTFHENSAEDGGGIALTGCQSATVTGCTFNENTAVAGGSIISLDTTVSIEDSTFTGEFASDNGGAISVCPNSIVAISGSTFSNNRSANAGGAVVVAGNGMEAVSVISVADSVFSGNAVEGDPPNAGFGGALVAQFAEVELRGVAFEDNEASNAGGAVLVESLSALDIEACVFARNSAGIDGGALMLWDSPASLRSSLLFDNAAANGGAICLATDDEPLPTSIDIRGATFFGNTATEAGGAVYARTGTVSAGNSIFRGDAPDVFAWDDGVDPAVATYCAVQGGWTGAGNLDADPLFTDAAAGNFRLLPGSPCLDAADGTAATEFDIDGLPRWDDPLAPNTGLGPPWADIGAHERQP